MRVIAGCARRTRLDVSPESAARPFLELARGALFNSLGSRVEGASVLDLYAGSGALGIEALSRGASSCMFVECDRHAADIIEGNLARCGFTTGVEVLRSRAQDVVGSLRANFDLVFVDPPFRRAMTWETSEEGLAVTAGTSRTLAPEGRIVFRLEEHLAAPPWRGLQLAHDRRYGRSRVCIYRLELGN